MALHTAIGAGTFSALAFSNLVIGSASLNATPTTKAHFEAYFTNTVNIVELPDIREMPQFGSPANIVKVPQYGVSQSLSIGAQPDAPDLELTVNYISSKWAPGQPLRDTLDSKVQRVFQFSLLYARPNSLKAGNTTGVITGAGLSSVENANIYFIGRMESLMIEPSLSDANTATLALSIQSDFYGPFTYDHTV
jgi:hypothetical protein